MLRDNLGQNTKGYLPYRIHLKHPTILDCANLCIFLITLYSFGINSLIFVEGNDI